MRIMAINRKMRADEPLRVTVSFSDSIDLIKDQVQWSPKGVSLLTKWPFQVGAEVEFAFDHHRKRHCCIGVVVACRPLRQPLGCYETVLYFVETPCSSLQKAACDCQLAREEQLRSEAAGMAEEFAMENTSRLTRTRHSGDRS
jgi:hypothetical protein